MRMNNGYNDFHGQKPPLCGTDWMAAHEKDHTQEEVDSLGMEIITDRNHLTVRAGMKAGNIRTALKAVTR
jgi:hypothetical protein